MQSKQVAQKEKFVVDSFGTKYQLIKSIGEGGQGKVLETDHSRACPHFVLHQIIMHAKYVIELKFLANLSNRVAILRKCFRRANIFSTKCLSL